MRTSKLLKTIAIASVVFIAGCNCNNEERWSGFNDGHPGTGTVVQLAPGAVDLGVAGNFVILSKSGITSDPASVITGDIGTSPITGAAITGITCPDVTGTIYTVSAAGPMPCRVIDPGMLTVAVLNMEAAYTDAAGRAADVTELGAGDISGMTLVPGVYKWSTGLLMTADVTLSGGADAVWIFQVAGTLTVRPDVKIILSGGAQAKNIFWQVAGVVALQERSHFEGTILAKTNITLTLGASVNGRLLAQTAVTLIGNTITLSGTSGGGTSGGGTKPPKYCRDFVTGGGWIKGNSDDHGHNNKATFGVSGGIMNGKFWGQLSYNDHGRNGVNIKSTKITDYIVIDSVTRQIEGIAKVGKIPVTFTVVVKDLGEPGRFDSFSLVLSDGYDYSASGTLEGGNIQLHFVCGDSHNKGDKEDYFDKDENDGHHNCDNDNDGRR